MSHFFHRDSAAHEVGHGLVARELGAREVTAFMRSERASYGGRAYCTFQMPDRDELTALWDFLTVSLAGCVGEHLHFGVDPLGPHAAWAIARKTLAAEDQPEPNAYEWAVGVLERLYDGKRATAEAALNRVLGDLLVAAVAILRRHQRELERLAKRLEVERKIII